MSGVTQGNSYIVWSVIGFAHVHDLLLIKYYPMFILGIFILSDNQIGVLNLTRVNLFLGNILSVLLQNFLSLNGSSALCHDVLTYKNYFNVLE